MALLRAEGVVHPKAQNGNTRAQDPLPAASKFARPTAPSPRIQEIGAGRAPSRANEFVILARDKGYDPLVKPDPSPKTSSPASKELDRVRANLGKVEKNKRPRKKATLVKYVSTVFGNKLPKAELAELVDDMFRRKLVSEANNAISYHF